MYMEFPSGKSKQTSISPVIFLPKSITVSPLGVTIFLTGLILSCAVTGLPSWAISLAFCLDAGLTSPQAAQALFSFGSGGMTGTGLGQGHSDLIGFAGRSDFILTTVGEELGLAGMTAVLLLYALLIERGLRTALDTRDPFGKLLATGLAGALALQVFVVAGGVTGLLPLTGKAMPFLAQGGSSQVANWVLIALLLKISDGARRPAPRPAAGIDEQETQLVRRVE